MFGEELFCFKANGVCYTFWASNNILQASDMSKRKKSVALIDSDSDESGSGSDLEEVSPKFTFECVIAWFGIGVSMTSNVFLILFSH